MRNETEPAATAGDTRPMTAIRQERYGAAPEDVLRVGELARPTPGAGEVLVHVRATSVDRGTWHLMAGLPYPVRAMTGARPPKDPNPGRNLAGVVVAVGTDVTAFAPGDEVYGNGVATFAEYATTRPERLAAKPAGLSFAQAAVAPVSGMTALQAVRDNGRVQPGQRVLITGASGGVGSFAVQLAKAFGADVTGVARTTKLDAVRALGADDVIDYTREDFLGGERRYDVIIDIAGNRGLAELRRALTPRGRLVIAGGETDGKLLGGTDRQLRAPLLSPFVGQKLGAFITTESADGLRTLAALMNSGKVIPVIDHTYPLTETTAALRHLLDGRATGKLAITI